MQEYLIPRAILPKILHLKLCRRLSVSVPGVQRPGTTSETSRCLIIPVKQVFQSRFYGVKLLSHPNVQGMSEKIGRVLRKEGLRVAHKPIQTISNIFSRPKDRENKHAASCINTSTKIVTLFRGGAPIRSPWSGVGSYQKESCKAN